VTAKGVITSILQSDTSSGPLAFYLNLLGRLAGR